jgi:SAM-dependent methyltransferase
MSETSSHVTRLAVTAAIAVAAGLAAGWYLRAEFPALLLFSSPSIAGKKKKNKKKKSTSSAVSQDPDPISVTSTGVGAGGGPGVYETKKAIDEYVQFHFGDPQEVLPWRDGPREALRFTERCADLCAEHCKLVASGKWEITAAEDEKGAPRSPHLQRSKKSGLALDVGCAVGGASFELTKHFRDVVGVDFSQSFVTTANLMKRVGSLQYTSVTEGTMVESRQTSALDPGIDRQRVEFFVADACALPKSMMLGGSAPADSELFGKYGRHDAVLAANLLCRLPDPEHFLMACARLVRPDGVLVLVSPYSWLEQWTPKHNWLGGGGGHKSSDVIKALLESTAGGFDFVTQNDLPFLIKEHDRKFQWGVSHATVWRRRNPAVHTGEP